MNVDREVVELLVVGLDDVVDLCWSELSEAHLLDCVRVKALLLDALVD